ncbi:hypothetical protein HII13_004743 [Brettanomyces bruxellensis]|uniref:DEBR0S5_02344g1_1 n=1 Tax=Dekkera bruxellensis TaxID=5007 RepID=A0A7D9H197_DEKBR|nr:uncharacterized protein BRETT_000131 [Brettanomyces bruxellensis]KAF6007066.1 hypothetical protein HII13_004743 [Brettanomyces bruxellensis]KAF6010244.1 hypothetical protein HII12_002951 [Brettanomyces bruxellensis]QOU18404.1 hypothetical protein BRETT_000131 [Brettanomyces bruxellensis]VUG19421.1 DEBR0S5_02344g1_1 [Brettanomyces bruxellensis]
MSALPPIRQFWKQIAFVSSVAIFAAYYAKNKVTIRRKQQFIKDSSSYDSLMRKRVRSGNSIATIKPGFPKEMDDEEYKRKSEFEGSGNSYMSRKHGDKFNMFDNWIHKGN